MVSRKGPVAWIIRIVSLVIAVVTLPLVFLSPSMWEVEDRIYELLESSNEEEERRDRKRNVALMVFVYLILALILYYSTHSPFYIFGLGVLLIVVVLFLYYALHIPLGKIVGVAGILLIAGAILILILFFLFIFMEFG